ncbi:hypothetical protein D3C81_1730590 [compost metagenome]
MQPVVLGPVEWLTVGVDECRRVLRADADHLPDQRGCIDRCIEEVEQACVELADVVLQESIVTTGEQLAPGTVGVVIGILRA